MATIRYKLLHDACGLTKGSVFAAGFDASARLDFPISLEPGKRVLVPLGIQLELPAGWECQVRPRSGLANKHGITILNTPGTIDEDFRGEVCAIVINHSQDIFTIKPYDRIAQLVFNTVPAVELTVVDELDETLRGEGGFGSSGIDGGKQQ